MSTFYTKTRSGKFIPITFEEIVTKDWENKLISIRVGSDEFPADDQELEEVLEGINDVDVLENLDTSFLVSLYNLEFEVLGSIKEVKEKYITVRVTSGDDLSNLGSLQQTAKEQLRGKAKKVIILPTSITVEEYSELAEIARRAKVRRARRSR